MANFKTSIMTDAQWLMLWMSFFSWSDLAQIQRRGKQLMENTNILQNQCQMGLGLH